MAIKKFLATRRLKKDISRYVLELPVLLEKDYGRADNYSELQIQKCISRHGLSNKNCHYALAIFLTESVFNEHINNSDESFEYDELRTFIGNEYFQSNSDFQVSDLTSRFSDFSHHTGNSFDSTSIGTDGGGGGD